MKLPLLNQLKRAGTYRIMLAVAAFVAVSACSSGGGGDASPGDAGPGDSGSNETSPTMSMSSGPIAGVWERCSSGFKTTYTFTDSRWTENKAVFQSEDCTGAEFPDTGFADFVFEGFYTLEGMSTSADGLEVQLFNMTSDKLDGVAVLDSARVSQYNIVYTGTPGQLVFGEFNQRSEENRPTQLLFDEPFLRR